MKKRPLTPHKRGQVRRWDWFGQWPDTSTDRLQNCNITVNIAFGDKPALSGYPP